MRIQVNTDNHIDGRGELIDRVGVAVQDALSRFGDQITRVEVHLNDVNGPRSGGDDKRCLIEARLGGRQPVAASHQAATLDQAVDGAAGKLKRSLDSTLGRLGGHKGQTSFGGDQTI